jgi:hypothetical protein
MRLSLGFALLLLAAACGDDAKKVTTTTCADDTDCAGGLCFESACFTACPDSVDPCADGTVCVMRTRDDGEHAVCVAAATIQCTTHDDCAGVHARECLHGKCDPDTLLCTLGELQDFSDCWTYEPTATSEAALPGDELTGTCYHGECRSPCAIDNECTDVCALKSIRREQRYCVTAAELPCRAEGFGEEFGDACSSVWNHADGVCEYSVSTAGPSPISDNCDASPAACISEGCAALCVSDADCAGKRCLGFYSFDPLTDGTEIGFYKACR